MRRIVRNAVLRSRRQSEWFVKHNSQPEPVVKITLEKKPKKK